MFESKEDAEASLREDRRFIGFFRAISDSHQDMLYQWLISLVVFAESEDEILTAGKDIRSFCDRLIKDVPEVPGQVIEWQSQNGLVTYEAASPFCSYRSPNQCSDEKIAP